MVCRIFSLQALLKALGRASAKCACKKDDYFKVKFTHINQRFRQLHFIPPNARRSGIRWWHSGRGRATSAGIWWQNWQIEGLRQHTMLNLWAQNTILP
jgi:hypothetical protein